MKKIQTKLVLAGFALLFGSVFLSVGSTTTPAAAACVPGTDSCKTESTCEAAGGIPQYADSSRKIYASCASACIPGTNTCKTEEECLGAGGAPQYADSSRKIYASCMSTKSSTSSSSSSSDDQSPGKSDKCETAVLPKSLCDKSGEGSGVSGLLLLVLNILTVGVGIAAVGGFVMAAIMYTTGGDSPERIKKAKDMMVNIVIGLIAYGLIYALLNFIVPGGVFK